MPRGQYVRGLPLAERFNQYVEPEPNSGCHLWTGHRNANGYGVMKVAGATVLAHRLAWYLKHWGWSIGVLHRCDNPVCVNLDHLYLGTPADNARDRKERDRGNRPAGERNPRARVTAEQVAWVRRMAGDDFPRDFIARYLGLSVIQVNKIVQRRAWRHIA